MANIIKTFGHITNANGTFDICMVEHLDDLWLATYDPVDDEIDTLSIVKDLDDAIQQANRQFRSQPEYVVELSTGTSAKRTFTKYPSNYVKASTEGCIYKVMIQFGDFAETAEEYVIDAPYGLSESDLYDYIPEETLKSKLEVVSVENDKEAWRLSKEEIDEFDSAWGYRGGVPEEEYDEDAAAEGEYDAYYDEPQYSGYMYNLEWWVKFAYVGLPEVTYTYNTEEDSWKGDDTILEYAWESVLEEFKIISFEVVE